MEKDGLLLAELIVTHGHWSTWCKVCGKFLGWFNSKWVYSGMVEYVCRSRQSMSILIKVENVRID